MLGSGPGFIKLKVAKLNILKARFFLVRVSRKIISAPTYQRLFSQSNAHRDPKCRKGKIQDGRLGAGIWQKTTVVLSDFV